MKDDKLTSDNDPIIVDFLPQELLGLPGRIGLSIAPGKKVKGAHGDWARNLHKDIERLKDVYGIETVVCLLDEPEFAELGIEDYLSCITPLMELIWMPLQGQPSATEAPGILRLARRIALLASQGKKVLIHCRAGLGRSGVVAAAVLITLGMEASEAIRVVRAARLGALGSESNVRAVLALQEASELAGDALAS